MTEVAQPQTTSVARWKLPSVLLSALSGSVVVLAFTLLHDIFILGIWEYLGQMLFAGALCGVGLGWSYRAAVPQHSTGAWFRYAGLYAAELIALGGVSLVVLQPRFTMAELVAADDSFDRLLPPSLPLMIGAMVVGTVLVWWRYGRRPAALAPIVVTQVLLVFLLGHQFAFLGLVEASTSLLVVFGEFAVLTVSLAAAFAASVMWMEIATERLREWRQKA